jgi:hypothetical protein
MVQSNTTRLFALFLEEEGVIEPSCTKQSDCVLGQHATVDPTVRLVCLMGEW